MVDTCAMCNGKFPENKLQLSHDIPRYLGGTDKDGRHYLCLECHETYDNIILKRCLLLVGEKTFLPSERIMWMKELSRQPEELKVKFREIAKQVKEETYG
jgi:hypothetical protein